MAADRVADASSVTVAGVAARRGIVVVGSLGSGVADTGSLFGTLIAGTVVADEPAPTGGGSSLGRMNEELLASAGGSWSHPPAFSVLELARRLSAHRDAARRALRAAFPPAVEETPWIWADPRLSILLPFWRTVLEHPPVVAWVVRRPWTAIGQAARGPVDAARATQLWHWYNRSALAAVGTDEVLMIRYETLLAPGGPRDGSAEPVEAFLGARGFVVAPVGAAGTLPGRRLAGGPTGPATAGTTTPAGTAANAGTTTPATGPPSGGEGQDEVDVLYAVLTGRQGEDGAVLPPGGEAYAGFYDEQYYRHYAGLKYARTEPTWVRFFEMVADRIVQDVRPRKALDAGCAIGLLVEALRSRGVDARGVDISAWAIKQVPDHLRPYCSVGSITEPFGDHFDLITCIEVLEHLPPADVREAVANLCAHADAVLVSSSPDDVADPTHLNLQPPDYWARRFAEQGFYRDFSVDAGYLTLQAALFRRADPTGEALVEGYEQLLRGAQVDAEQARHCHQEVEEARDLAISQRDAAIAEHDAVASRLNALGAAHEELAQRTSELEQRRAAEAAAAYRKTEFMERRHVGLVQELAVERDAVSRARAEVAAIEATKVFRYSRRLRRAYARLLRRPAREVGGDGGPPAEVGGHEWSYQEWIARFDTLDDAARARLEGRLSALAHRPAFSIVLPVYDTPVALLTRAVESVREQIYPTWQLCIADDASTDPAVAPLLDGFARQDPRIKVVHRPENGHIAAASNSALALATGEWVLPMDHDDELAPHALAVVAVALAGRPDAGLVYTDEDKRDVDGRRHSAYFKPDFDPLLLLGQNYLGHLVLYRHDLVQAVGGYREGLEGSQDWDLTLRVTEQLDPGQVLHVPRILYHWRVHPGSTATGIAAKPYAADAGRRAVVAHLARQARPAEVIMNPSTGWHRIRWQLPDPAPKVSILVPTRDGQLLGRCLDSLFRLTAYPSYELVVVDNGSLGSDTLDYLRAHEHVVKVVRDERPFNFSALNNEAAARADGEILCLLNDDCEVTTSDWLDELVSQLVQPGVGAVGAKLLYPDGRIQHAGVVLGLDGVAGHVHRLRDRMASGHGGRLHVAQSFSAVTAACMAVRREAWEQVGGLDAEHLPVAFNDIDFCLRLRAAGWRIVWTPFTQLTHYESLTRGEDTGPRAAAFARECDYMRTRWGKELRCDPAFNPNLSLVKDGPECAFPPRTECWPTAFPDYPSS